MKRAIIAVCTAAIVLFLLGPVTAEDRVTVPGAEVSKEMTATEFEKDMTAEEWAKFKRDYMSRKPIPQMRPTFPGCYVCNDAPVCRSGFKMVGFIDVINYVTHIAWGEDNPSAGGYVRIMSKTINQNGMCVHDHIKGAVCNKLSAAIPGTTVAGVGDIGAGGADSTGAYYYNSPDEPLQPDSKLRSDCLSKWVTSEVKCSSTGYFCGWAKVSMRCNYGTPDQDCCKTQQQVQYTWEQAREKAYQAAKRTCSGLIHQCTTIRLSDGRVAVYETGNAAISEPPAASETVPKDFPKTTTARVACFLNSQPMQACQIVFKSSVSKHQCVTGSVGSCTAIIPCCRPTDGFPIIWEVSAITTYGIKEQRYETNCGWPCDKGGYLKFDFKTP